jgi:uncharacterized cupin superfamily protein
MQVRLRAPMAEIDSTPDGDVPRGTGWYVLNARQARWLHLGSFGGSDCHFEGDERFGEFGFHLGVIQPGEPISMYHAEDHQEGFLVLEGQCMAIVESEEVPLRAWDYFHCPSGTAHTLVGAGDGPCLVIGVGGRVGDDRTRYLPDPTAARHGAAVDVETCDPRVAYEGKMDPKEGRAPEF